MLARHCDACRVDYMGFDTELLKRAFLGWLRGEPGHCSMAAIPTREEEDAKRPNREREGLVGERTRIVNRIKSTLARLGIRGLRHCAPRRCAAAAEHPGRAAARHGAAALCPRPDPGDRGCALGWSGLARIVGSGVEPADTLMAHPCATAGHSAICRRWEKGLARTGNARVRRGMIQLTWRSLMFRKGQRPGTNGIGRRRPMPAAPPARP
jgi:transposase